MSRCCNALFALRRCESIRPTYGWAQWTLVCRWPGLPRRRRRPRGSLRRLRPLVYHDLLAGAVFFTSYVGWCVWELALQRRTARTDESDRTRMGEVVLTTLGAALIFPASSIGARLPGPRWAPVVVGVALLLAGWWFRRWSVQTLGRFFTVTVSVEEGQTVVDSGPYRVLRHPSYTGMLVSLLGMGIALDSWASVAVALLLPLVAVLRRIREEEGFLGQELGQPYRDYARRTHRLVPGVW